MSETENPHHLPRHTTPTWEVELLISGVAVFAMLQLPGWLDDRVFALLPRLDADWANTVVLLYFYAKSAAVILAVTFSLHLLLRARWIALVGMHSIHADDIRWDKFRMGPVQRQVEQSHNEPTSVVIERADNMATIVFAVGVMIAMMIGIITLALGTIFVSLNLFVLATGIQIHTSRVALALFAVVMLPFGIVTLLDRRAGGRALASGPMRGIATALFRFYNWIGLGRSRNRLMALLISHGGDRIASLLTMTIMGIAIIAVAMAFNAMQSPLRAGSYGGFPDPEAGHAIDSAHYDDQRNPARDEALPYVQSMVVDGPYVRLVVPFRPELDESAMRGCAIPAGTDDAKTAARLDCLQSLHGVTLDGKPLADPEYEIGSDPRTDRPALVAMIDVRALAPGRHELQVARPPESGKKHKDDPGFDRIPFWR